MTLYVRIGRDPGGRDVFLNNWSGVNGYDTAHPFIRNLTTHRIKYKRNGYTETRKDFKSAG